MPSTDTITAFYTFLRARPARASQANANFAALRGHMLPIDPNTATAISATYDVGALDSRWRALYSRTLDLSQTTTTSRTVSATTGGSFIFKEGSTEMLRVTAPAYFLSGYAAGDIGVTTSSVAGGFAVSSVLNTTWTTPAGDIAGTTLTIATLGRPVMVGLIADNSTLTASFVALKTGDATTTSNRFQAKATISLKRDGVIVQAFLLRSGMWCDSASIPPGYIDTVDFAATAGSHTYSLHIDGITTFSSSVTLTALQLSNVRLYAKEVT